MAMNNARLYAPIEKTEEQPDGTIKVWGYASAPTEDSDGETITADAMKAALPDYMKFGAVREMHGKSAAGTAIEADVQEDGRTWFGAHVVDPIAIKKVQTKVYKGFSIGGRITARDDLVKTTITGLKLVEVSLVDRPANPDAVFTMFKAESELSAVQELAKMVDDGVTTPEQIVEMIKASVAAPTPDVEPVAIDALVKGMGNVAELASYLRCIAYMVADQQRETAREGDGSMVAGQLKAWLSDGIGIFNAMTAEETAELLANLPDPDQPMVVDVLYCADDATDVAKAGARNSKTDKATIQSMHDGSVALGADCGSGKADAGGDLAKVEAVTAERDAAIAKADALTLEVEKLKKAPANGKAILRALDKAADVIEVVKTEETMPADATPEQRALFEVKKSLRSPIRIAN